MTYIKRFKTYSEFRGWCLSGHAAIPRVCYVEDVDKIYMLHSIDDFIQIIDNEMIINDESERGEVIVDEEGNVKIASEYITFATDEDGNISLIYDSRGLSDDNVSFFDKEF